MNPVDWSPDSDSERTRDFARLNTESWDPFFWGGDQTLQMYGHFEGFPKFFGAWGLGWRHISWPLLQGRHTKSFSNTSTPPTFNSSPRKSQGKVCLPPSFKGELLVFGGVFVHVGYRYKYRYMLLMYFVLGCHWANNGGFEEIHWDSQPSPYHETGIIIYLPTWHSWFLRDHCI